MRFIDNIVTTAQGFTFEEKDVVLSLHKGNLPMYGKLLRKMCITGYPSSCIFISAYITIWEVFWCG